LGRDKLKGIHKQKMKREDNSKTRKVTIKKCLPFVAVECLRPFLTFVGIELKDQDSNHPVNQQKKKTEKLLNKISVH
jgi:hypothetical protein